MINKKKFRNLFCGLFSHRDYLYAVSCFCVWHDPAVINDKGLFDACSPNVVFRLLRFFFSFSFSFYLIIFKK
jgi:hypothetical protein